MATHSSTLAWKIPWMEEPGRLQCMGFHRVRHDWVTSLSFCSSFWRRKWQPTPVVLPGESLGRRDLVGCSLWGRTESDTTKQLIHTHTSQISNFNSFRSSLLRRSKTQNFLSRSHSLFCTICLQFVEIFNYLYPLSSDFRTLERKMSGQNVGLGWMIHFHNV